MDHPSDFTGHTAAVLSLVEGALVDPPRGNVTRLAIHPVDDADRAYVHREFDDVARAIEALPRMLRVHLRCELSDRHKAALADAAALLQAIGAIYAPQPRDCA